ncbi:MAG: transglutaminase domain-containing protein [Acutalibacteraceae bacterium]
MKRFFVIIIACVFLFSDLTIAVSAENDEEFEKIPYVISDSIDYDKVYPQISGEVSTYYYKNELGKPIYSSYSLLDDCQKKIYNSVVDAPIGTLTITITFDKNEFLYSNFNSTYLTAVMNAVCLDNPGLFYYSGYTISNGYLYSGGTSISKMDYTITLNSASTYTSANIAGYYEDLISDMQNITVDLSNRYNFVKSVHDYLCNNIYYPDLNSSDYVGNAHDAYGAIVEKRAVCQGYSEAFKLICDYYKIPAVCLTGTANGGGHMWNAVQMDDGNWYLLDMTWDDQGSSGTFYDFFLVGLDTVDTYFGKNAFSVSHVSDGNSYLPVLPYSSVKYSQTQHNTAFAATYNSLAKNDGRYLIRSPFDVTDSNIYYNGIYVELENPVTNSDFTVPSGTGGNSEVWTLVLLGDCDGDGLADVSDFSVAVNTVMANSDISDAYDMAADINCDGYLDVIDLAMLSLVANELDTEIIIE